MLDSVGYDCSTEYGTLSWASKKCDKDPNCEFVHDYGCDNASWRYCPNLLVDQNWNNQGQACSRLKIGEPFVKQLEIFL